MVSYDAWIPNLGDWNFLAEGQKNLTSPYVQAAVIDTICPVIQDRCQGADQQYASYVIFPTPRLIKRIVLTNRRVAECAKTLSKLTFGDYDDVWSDSVVCRTVHIILALVRPDVHCAHVGPTGGGKCADWPYNNGYFDDEELFGQKEGQTFICPEKKHCHEY